MKFYGLGQHRTRDLVAFGNDFLGMASEKNDLRTGYQGSNSLPQNEAIHLRHLDISDQQIRAALPLNGRKGLLATRRNENLMLEGIQKLADSVEHG